MFYWKERICKYIKWWPYNKRKKNQACLNIIITGIKETEYFLWGVWHQKEQGS